MSSSFISRICFFLIGFIVIGTCIRGGWQERPIDWGHAMFSNNKLANQTALNTLFNLSRSIIQLHSEKNISNNYTYRKGNNFGLEGLSLLVLSYL